MIEIEKNIPMPPRGARQGKYPFAHMEVGDSFFVRQTEASKNSVISSVQWAKGKFGFRFTVRADNDNAGWRVWRVA
jgi:hypothetical protein